MPWPATADAHPDRALEARATACLHALEDGGEPGNTRTPGVPARTMCGMKLRYLLPCAELHRNDSGLVSVFGVLDYLWFPSFPGSYNLTVGLSLEAAPAEISLDIPGELVITGPAGEIPIRQAVTEPIYGASRLREIIDFAVYLGPATPTRD